MTLRKLLVAILALAIFGAALAADAQQPKRVARIGWLGIARSPLEEGFKLGLLDLGWIEGQNVIIEWRYAGKVERLPEMAAELVRLNVDVILAPSSTQVRAARQATSTIPIVFASHADPVGVGDVVSLARPGGNITGVSQLLTDLSPKLLQLLKEAVPGAARIAVLWNPTTPSHPPALKAMEEAARILGVRLQTLEARGPEDFDSAFAAMDRERAGALLVVPSPMSFFQRERLAELALKHRLPAMSALRENAEAGGLMSYGPDLYKMFRRSAALVDKILKGAKPADLPVEQATEFELVVNLKTAKALGLTLPQSVLVRAADVIQ